MQTFLRKTDGMNWTGDSEADGPFRLVIFDVDGTLVDSQATIVACASEAFAAAGVPPPTPDAIRRIVGLSLGPAMARLLDDPDPQLVERIAENYRQAFFARRSRPDFEEPLFPGARDVVETLHERGAVLGVATGKAMRGLLAVLERHGLRRYFTTLQTADLHPSKPHPAMVEAALVETGASPAQALLVGDTTFDVSMAVSAGVTPIGVAWGNHPVHELRDAGAGTILESFDELLRLPLAARKGGLT